MKILKYGELFCGPGGLAKGAMLASSTNSTYSIEHAWANDIHADSCDTYSYNICGKLNDPTVVCGDVREKTEFDLKSMSDIDILAFGFPCNDFSLVGEQLGIDGKYGPLYSYGIKTLNYFNPMVFVAENVSGIRSSNEGRAFQQILEELNSAGKSGYSLTVNEYHFEKYMVPQNRHRVVIVGFRKDLKFHYKVPGEITQKTLSCGKAIENPPILSDAYNHDFTQNSKNVKERLSYIGQGENIWNAKRLSEMPDYLKLNVKGAKLSQIYRRLKADEPAYTVTGSGGGGTHIYHWKENRSLTNRERARLQTFPDDYKFFGLKEAVRRQIGMAVPVQGSKIIFESILNTIAGRKYKSKEPSIGFYD